MRKYHLIKFKQGEFSCLRVKLLEDISKEAFAILFGKKETIAGIVIINVIETKFLNATNYNSQSMSHLNIRKDFIYDILADITNRYDIDTIIDVHTHPFCKTKVGFSGVDDRDERTFFSFLNEKFDNINYASVVLSQEEYSARLWRNTKKKFYPENALIKTQTTQEKKSNSDFSEYMETDYQREAFDKEEFFNRGILTLGLNTMRQIMNDQVISIVGVGGTGSIVAEHLVHMGFHTINLIDPDVLEVSNLNRIVGAYYEDALSKKYKVDVIKTHLDKINPQASVTALKNDVYDESIEKVLALSDWIILATDNHSSRFKTQQLSFKYFVPFISLGVNITVNNNLIEDMSGEVITVRIGDYFCLNCLKRINPTKIAAEKHPEKHVREKLVARGYVTGKDIKEPAVKTLNCMTATLAVDILINQFTGHQKHEPIIVYEGNKYKAIYKDVESIRSRNMDCYTCNI